MKVSDYVALFLKVNGIKHVFGLQGGAVVHLFDSVERIDGISAIYVHHEQSAALAATSNSKITRVPGCCIVTTGPGCTNTITGLLAAWQDSAPVLFISGQTRVEHTSYGKPVRQVGSQEFNILDIVKPITKYSKLVSNSGEISSVLEDALFHATEGRMGPVWIDIPVNIQWEEVVIPQPKLLSLNRRNSDNATSEFSQFNELLKLIKASKRPLVVAGNGVRASKSEDALLNFLYKTDIPFVSTWTASDLTATESQIFCGIIGVAGQRGANKILYQADLIICLGCHLSITQISTMFSEFAPNAKKAIIDIDRGELENLNVHFDMMIQSDLCHFFEFLGTSKFTFKVSAEWTETLGSLKQLNSTITTLTEKSSTGDESYVNSNYFNIKLTSLVPATSHIVVDGGGTALYTGFQSTSLKNGQRIICSSAISAMGTGLPESIGVAYGSPLSEIYCIIGDGSLMLNMQELQTIFHHNLPIKIIVYNNSGYQAIKHTQKSFLGARYFGTDAKHGISFPAIHRIAECFRLDYMLVESVNGVEAMVDKIVKHKGPLLVEVMVSDEQSMLFQQGYKEISKDRFQPCNLSEMQPYMSELIS